jgi:threonine/homoserine/homoserine lactone efflux protein
VAATVTNGRALRYAGGSARGLLHQSLGHCPLMFTQFLAAGPVSHVALVLAITTVFTVNNFIAFTLWTLAGDRLAALFWREKSARRLNLVFGTMLAAVAVWMALA